MFDLNAKITLHLECWAILNNVFFFFFPQVDALLCSLDIDNDNQIKGPLPGRARELEGYWNESQGINAPVADGWVTEFRQLKSEPFNPNGWANLFEQEHGPNGWASEFEHVRSVALNSAASLASMTSSSYRIFQIIGWKVSYV